MPSPWNRSKLKERLLKRRYVDPITGCWLYTGYVQKSTRTGALTYGKMRVGKRLVYVHKVSAWVFLKKSSAIAHSRKVNVCHKCDNPPCFCPDHLKVSTPRWNTLDSVIKGIHFMAGKTECKYGHPFSGNNLINSGRQRACRACRNRRAREAYRHKCST